MKHLPLLLLAMASIATGCGGWQRVGQMTMVSTRNVDSAKPYALVMRGVEATAKMKQDDAMQAAVDKAVAMHPGGEYMMNVSIYVAENGKQVKVTGDVWGLPVAAGTASSATTGSVEMKVGDAVLYHVRGQQPRKGTLIGIRGAKGTVEFPTRGRPLLKEVELRHLTRVE